MKPDELTPEEIERIIDAGEKVMHATEEATNLFVQAVEQACDAAGVPASAVMTWHLGRILAGMCVTEGLDLDRTAVVIRNAAAMALVHAAQKVQN